MTAFGTTLHYQGYVLKSKVEFAWARFFHVEGFDWEYEPVKFRAGRESYTPDFGLDGRAFFIETKAYGAKNIHNRFELCDKPLLLIYGAPERHYIRFKPAGAVTFQPGHYTNWTRAYEKVCS